MKHELEGVRESINDLSTNITRIALLRVVVLFLLTTTMSAAFEQLSEKAGEIKDLQDQIAETAVDLLHNPFSRGSTGRTKSPPSPEEQAAQTKRQDAEKKLEAIYHDAFTKKVSVLVADTEVDLRMLLYALPPCLILSEMYLAVLRRKRALLTFAAGSRRSEIGLLDSLTLNADGTRLSKFAIYPARQLEALSLLLTVLLLLGIGYASYPFWQSWIDWDDPSAYFFEAVIVFLSCVIYAAWWCEAVSRRLSSEIESIISKPPPPTWVTRSEARMRKWGNELASRVRPRLSLGVGSALLLASLFLATGMDSCGKAEPGYKLAIGHSDWFTSVLVIGQPSERYLETVGVAMYDLALLLTLATISFVIFNSIQRSSLPKFQFWLRLVYRCTVLVALFLLGEFASAIVLADLPEVFPFVHLLVLSTWLAWISRPSSSRFFASNGWTVFCRLLAALWVPIEFTNLLVIVALLASSVNSSADNNFRGLLAYYFGFGLLALGYRTLLRQTDSAKPSAESRPAEGLPAMSNAG